MKIRISCISVAAMLLATVFSASAQSYDSPLTGRDVAPSGMTADEAYRQAEELLKKLDIDEKCLLVRGRNKFFIADFPEKGMTPVFMRDATMGVRLAGEVKKSMQNTADSTTAFPATIALASTFNPELSYAYAKAVGEECRVDGAEILLGPGMNVARQSQCARNFEYFGEDPFLISAMVDRYVRGVQSTGTAATIKHFLGNQTEFYRKKSNSIIDERTIHEIYLPAFVSGINAGAMCVMTSYNLVNGTYAGSSKDVITELLRKELGFRWLVMSDWNSVYDLKETILSGQNLEMPGSYDFGTSVKELYDRGEITEDDLDRMIRPILATCIAMNFYGRERYDKSLYSKYPEHVSIGKQTADEGIVLLKNNGILPLDPAVNRNILVTGRFAKTIARGGGAARVAGYGNRTLMDELVRKYGRCVYYIEKPSVAELKAADVVILTTGTIDSESVERPFGLPKGDESFANYVTSNNSNTITVAYTGSGINMSSWNDRTAALLYAWYPGQMGNSSLVDILAGDVNPSGKLPLTIEKSFSDSPGKGTMPKGAQFYNECRNEQLIRQYDVTYSEGVLVGYRWYDTKGIEPLYWFGHGLSYTDFNIEKAVLSKKNRDKGVIRCEVTICNTGDREGAEVIQLYTGENRPSVPRPVKELKAFAKVNLKPGERKTVTLELKTSELGFWNPETRSWDLNGGDYTIFIGTSAKEITHKLSYRVG